MKRVAFLMSDTGGGHRAAGCAIEAALHLKYPGMFEAHYVDVFRRYIPPPWKYAPEIYPHWVKYSSATYALFFWFFEQLMRWPFARNALPTLIAGNSLRQLLDEFRPDILVVLHATLSGFAAAGRRRLKLKLPIVTVVTDLAKPHIAWYHPLVDRCLVPCSQAYELGLKLGLKPTKMRVVGHPAHPKFALYSGDKQEARRDLNWEAKMPAVMILGGGEGMGKIDAIARVINEAALDAQIAVVCGRNEELKRRLKAVCWNQKTYVYGFVKNVEVMMRASDVLITKAGPGTIAEAAISGLPMILSGAIPLQETPNVSFVVENGAGVFIPKPQDIAKTLQKWLTLGDDMLVHLATRTQRIAYPNATFDIAGEIAAQLELEGSQTRDLSSVPLC